MTRELLELAAKAVGYRICSIQNGKLNCYGLDGKHNFHWNPLTDDGDALRLAVKLGLKIEHYSVTSEGRCRVGAGTGFPPVTYEGDQNKATRYAIVKTAAEIGKDMK